MSQGDFYAILGVTRDADSQSIRQAFKKLALTYHPDKVCEAERSEAEIQFKIISEAYEVLSNEESRMIYDAQTQYGGSGDWHDFYAPPQEDFFGFGFDSQFESQFGSQFYAPPPPRHSSLKRTEDAVFEVEISLEDVFSGKMLKLNSTRQVLCRRCEGTGGKRGAKKHTCQSCKGMGTTRRTQLVGPSLFATSTVICPICNGEGNVFRDKDLCRRCKGKKVEEVKTLIEVYIPKGVKNRHRIVIEGHSDEEPGKLCGDLVILILVNSEHHTFRREGPDLYATSQISLKEALTGLSRPLITHLDGRKLRPTIPRGHIIKPGGIVKIPGEGLIIEDTSAGTEVIGDMYIRMEVQFPASISEHILDKLATLLSVEDEYDSDRSDDTLSEGGFARDARRTAKADFQDSEHFTNNLDGSVAVDHEIMDETDLPEYLRDANDEPEPEGSETDPDANTSKQHSAGGSKSETPGCAQM